MFHDCCGYEECCVLIILVLVEGRVMDGRPFHELCMDGFGSLERNDKRLFICRPAECWLAF